MALTPEGSRLAAKITASLADSTLYLSEKEISGFPQATPFTDFKSTLADCFGRYEKLVCIMATGIVVRLLAPLLAGL